MKVQVVGFGAVLSHESAIEIEYLREFLNHKHVIFSETISKDGHVIIYLNEDFIGRLPKNQFGAYLPTSESDGPALYEIYNMDI